MAELEKMMLNWCTYIFDRLPTVNYLIVWWWGGWWTGWWWGGAVCHWELELSSTTYSVVVWWCWCGGGKCAAASCPWCCSSFGWITANWGQWWVVWISWVWWTSWSGCIGGCRTTSDNFRWAWGGGWATSRWCNNNVCYWWAWGCWYGWYGWWGGWAWVCNWYWGAAYDWWWCGWWRLNNGCNATNCWWWGGGAWCAAAGSWSAYQNCVWWNWACWVVDICYPADWSYKITCATWWTKSLVSWMCVHRFTSNWTFTIVS